INESDRHKLLSKRMAVMNIALRSLRRPILWGTVAVAITILALSWPQKAQGTLRFVVESFIDVAPIVAVGLVLSAWVAASGAATVTARWFEGRPTSTIIVASAIGAVTPVCGVTVLPLMTGFLAAG